MPLALEKFGKEPSAQVPLGAEETADQVSPVQVSSDSEVPNKAFSEQAPLGSEKFGKESSA